jgi:hypothetical protein
MSVIYREPLRKQNTQEQYSLEQLNINLNFLKNGLSEYE